MKFSILCLVFFHKKYLAVPDDNCYQKSSFTKWNHLKYFLNFVSLYLSLLSTKNFSNSAHFSYTRSTFLCLPPFLVFFYLKIFSFLFALFFIGLSKYRTSMDRRQTSNRSTHLVFTRQMALVVGNTWRLYYPQLWLTDQTRLYPQRADLRQRVMDQTDQTGVLFRILFWMSMLQILSEVFFFFL